MKRHFYISGITVYLMLIPSFVWSQTAIDYDAKVSKLWQFNSGIIARGDNKVFYTDGLKPFYVGNQSLGVSLQMAVAEGAGNYNTAASSKDFIMRALLGTSKFIICNGTEPNTTPSQATGVLGSYSADGIWVYNNNSAYIGSYMTTSPMAKLQVMGNGAFQNRLQLGNTNTTWLNNTVTGYANGTDASDAAIFMPLNSGGVSDLRLYIPDDIDDSFSIWGNTCSGGNCSDLNAASKVVSFRGDGVVSFNGNIGIGTTDAISKLTVVGNSTTGDLYKRTSILLRNANQTPGDGVTTYNLASYLAETGNVRSIFEARNDNGYVHGAVGTSSNHDFIVFSNSAERIRIASNGNVGIGKSPEGSNKLDVAGSIRATEGLYVDHMAIDHPNVTDDWNTIWQNGFFDSTNGNNSPEPGGHWFWGLNIGHRSNHPNYRYGGQLVIKNASDTPTLYFRSRNEQGAGVWAKVLHNLGDQQIKGGLVVDGTIRAEEVKVEVITASQMNVDGDVYANKVKVAANGQTADFVFEDDYDLKDLAEVETYIKEHKHLPNIPSATEMEANGVDVAEMNKLLLQKVEELTLYVIKLENEKDQLATSSSDYLNALLLLTKRIEILENKK